MSESTLAGGDGMPTTPAGLRTDYRVNALVERLQRYVPLDAGADQLVHEHVDVRESIDIETRADSALLEAVSRPESRLVLLTGDAGHGKTRLCCRLLESFRRDRIEAAQIVRDHALGMEDLDELPDGRTLRIVKDLSDFEPEEGAQAIADALDAPRRVTVVCVNEGRLRDIVSRRPDRLSGLLRRLEDGLSGDAALADGVVIINLNFQSVASPVHSLVETLLQRWVGDGRSWTTCSSCRAQPLCPIYENRRLLSESPLAATRTKRWSELLRAAERTGVVITIRELLVTVAYALTGGLQCGDVHTRVEARPVDRSWQWRHLFFHTVFGEMSRLEETSPGLRVPPAMERLDPGRFADRRIDECLEVDGGDVGFRPHDPTGDDIGTDWRETSAKQARLEQLVLTRFLRRRAFFDDDVPPAPPRVGLRFGAEFDSIVDGGSAAEIRTIRDRLVRGVAAVQGLVVTGARPSSMPIVEPAVAGRGHGVAILDRDIRLAAVEVMTLSDAWRRALERDPELPRVVDWTERSIAVVIENSQIIEMDLRTFELVCAASEGLDLGTADPGVARRLLLQLAALAGAGDETERITVIEPGRRWQIDLDIGDQLIGLLS
jgi:hypothetical protein